MQAFLALAFVATAASSFADMKLVVEDASNGEEEASINFVPRLENTGTPGTWTSEASSPEFTYFTEDGSARAGSDYVASSGKFAFRNDDDGVYSSFQIPLMQDIIAEADEETFTVKIGHHAANSDEEKQITIGNTQAVGSIVDDDNLVITLPAASATECDGCKFTFNLQLSHAADTDVTVDLRTLADQKSAVETDDYVRSVGSVTFSPGDMMKTFDVMIQNDDIQEDVETFEVLVSYQRPAAQTILDILYSPINVQFSPANRKAVGTFLEEDEGVTVCVDDVLMAEGASESMVFSVKLSHQVATDVSVAVETVDGTGVHIAQQDVHYYSGARTIQFPSLTADTQTFSVTVINDDIQSPHAQMTDDADFGPVNFGLTSTLPHSVWSGSTGGADNPWNVKVCGGSSVRTQTAKGSIYDFEDVTVALSAGSTLIEDDNSTNFEFTVSLSHKVDGSTQSGSAARGASFYFVDYNSNAVTMSQGQASIEVNTFSTGCDDLPGFGSTAMPATGPVDVCWPGSINPKLDGVVGGDPTLFTFNAVPLEGAVPHIAQMERGPVDYIIEGEETFQVGIELEPVAAAGYRIRSGSALTTVATITDNEPVNFTFTPSSSVTPMSKDEGDGVQFEYTVALTHTSAVEVSFDFATVDGTAVGGDDFTSVDETLTWPAFSNPGTERVSVVKVINDNVAEETETFSTVFSNAQPATMTGSLTSSLTTSITDNEGLTISIDDMSGAKDESESNWSFSVTLSHESSHEQTVTYSTSVDAIAANAAAVSRFSTATNSLTFPAYTTEGIAAISVVDDNVQTGPAGSEQVFKVTLATTTAPEIQALGSKLSAQARISDDEGVVVTLTQAFVSEVSGGVMEFDVTLSHPVSEAVSVSFTTSDGTALTSGSAAEGMLDFTPSSSASLSSALVSFSTLQTSSTLSILIANDDVQEFTETFSVSLDAVITPSNSGFTINPTSNSVEGTVFDDEKVKMSISREKGHEGGTLSFTVKLTHRVDTDVVIAYELIDGTATLGVDYQNDANIGSASGTVTVSKHTTLAFIDVTLTDDILAEKAETFIVQLTNVVSPTTMSPIFAPGDTGSAAGTIGDVNSYDEGLTVAIVTPSAVDRSQEIDFSVSLSHAVQETVYLAFASADRTAMKITDYTEVTGSLMFAGSDQIETNNVKVSTFIPACQEKQATKAFTFSVTPASGMAQGVVSVDAILNPFDHQPKASITDSTSNEDQTMEFTVTLTHCVAEDVFIGYSTTPDTAYGSVHYTPPLNTFVTFPVSTTPGPATETFGITILNDNKQGTSRKFGVQIGDAVAPAPSASTLYNVNFTAGSTAEGTINDDEHVTVSISECVTQNPSVDTDFQFTVTLSHVVETLVQVNYQTSDITAEAGLDYQATSGRVQFVRGSYGDKIVSVTAIERTDVVQPDGIGGQAPPTRFALNIVPEVDAVFDVTLDGPTFGKGAIMGTLNTAVSMPRAECTEGGFARFVATIEDELATDVVVRYTVESVSATSEFDLSNANDTFTFFKNRGKNQQGQFSVRCVDDWLVEETERFTLKLEVESPIQYRNAIVFDGVVGEHIIYDNDAATVEILDATGVESNNIAGDDENMVFTVKLSHWVAADVNVDFTANVADCSATPTIACLISTATKPAMSASHDVWLTKTVELISFPGTQSKSQDPVHPQATLTYQILNDNVQEPSESFSVAGTVSSTMSKVSTADVSATGTIIDVEGATFTRTKMSGGQEGQDYVWSLTLSHQISTGFVLNYENGDYPNYISPNAGDVSFTSSQSTATLIVQTLPNTILDVDDVDFGVKLLKTEPNMNFDMSDVTGALVDDVEPTGRLFIATSTASADEEAVDSTLTFEIFLTIPVTGGFDIEYSTTDLLGQAVAGGPNPDYEPTSGSYTFLGSFGERKRVPVRIFNDELAEDNEEIGFNVDILNQKVKSKLLVEKTKDPCCQIQDNERATLNIQDSQSVEGTGMIFTVYLSHEVGDNTDFKLQYNAFALADDNSLGLSAAWGASRQSIVGEKLGQDFVPAVNAESSRFEGYRGYITVPIVDDQIVETREAMVFQIAAGPDKFTYTADTAFGYILDNERATVSISTDHEVSETDGTVKLTVTLSHHTQPDVKVSYATIDGYATHENDEAFNFNVDYTKTEDVIVFSNVFTGVSGPEIRKMTVSIPIVDDHIVEEDFEDFCVQLRSVVEPASIGVSVDPNQRDGFVILVDDAEAATIYVDSTSASEGSDLEFTVKMSHFASVDVDVAYETSAVSADTSDYTDVSGSVKFTHSINAGAAEFAVASPIVTVGTTTDSLTEYNEVFDFKLGPVTVESGLVGSVAVGASTLAVSQTKGIAHGKIMDSSGKGDLNIHQLTIEDGSALEKDGFVVFTVLYPRHSDVQHAEDLEVVNFKYTTYAGSDSATSAIPDRDYQRAVDVEVTMGPSETSKEITIDIIDDDWVQPDHVFSVQISSADTLIAKSSATMTIIDDDQATISVESVKAQEADGSIAFPIKLSAPVQSDLLIKLDGQLPGGVSGPDRLVVPAGVSEITYVYDIENDNVQENSEVFQVDGASLIVVSSEIADGRVQWGEKSASGEILDDEFATVSLTGNANMEEGATLRYEVKLSHALAAGVANTVEFSIVGRGYSLPDGGTTVTFATRTSSPPVAEIVIESTNNEVAEPDQILQLAIVSTNGPFSVTAGVDDTAEIIIKNDDTCVITVADSAGEESGLSMSFPVTLSHQIGDAEVKFNYKALSLSNVDPSDPAVTFALSGTSDVATPTIGAVGVIQTDFQAASGPVVIVGNSLKGAATDIRVVLHDDTEQECDEKFSLQLTDLVCGASSCSYVRLATATATGTIENDDEGFSITAVARQDQLSENFGLFTFDISLSHSVDGSFTLTTTVQPGDASSRISATEQSFEVSKHLTKLPQLPSMKTWSDEMQVSIVDDIVAQAPATFTVALSSNKACPLPAGSLVNGQATLLDNEDATMQLLDFSGKEDGAHSMTVQLSHAIEKDLQVNFEVTDGTLDDFDSLSGTVSFTAASGSSLPLTASASVEVKAEVAQREQDESYAVALTDVPSFIRASSPATLTVIDDELRSVDITVSEVATVSEGTTVSYTISFAGTNEEAFEFKYVTTSNGVSSEVFTVSRAAGGPWDPLTIPVSTQAFPGCSADYQTSITLSDLTGAGNLKDSAGNSPSSLISTTQVTDSNRPTASVAGASFVQSGSPLVLDMRLSASCPFDIRVPAQIEGAGQISTTSCTVAAGSSSCQISNPTPADVNSTYTARVQQTTPELGLSSVAATGKIATARDITAVFAANAKGCGSGVIAQSPTAATVQLVNSALVVSDFKTKLSLLSCFVGLDASTSIEMSREGELEAVVEFGKLSLSLPRQVDANTPLSVTLEATRGSEKVAIVFTVQLIGLQVDSLNNLERTGVTIPQGGQFQSLVSNILNIRANGNMNCNTDATDEPHKDCCTIDNANVEVAACERFASTSSEAEVVESVKVSFEGANVGTTSVCMGLSVVEDYCFPVTVTAPPVLSVSVLSETQFAVTINGVGTKELAEVFGAPNFAVEYQTISSESTVATVTAQPDGGQLYVVAIAGGGSTTQEVTL